VGENPRKKQEEAKTKRYEDEKERIFMTIITLDDLSKAIAHRVGIDIEEARRDAGFVMDIFGFDDRVIDNVLDPEDRQLFYILEEEGMLTTEREETTLYDGREWRTHYWRLKKDTIARYSKEIGTERTAIIGDKKQLKNVSDDDIYNIIEDDMWTTTRKTA
jgi:hypothetical protein